MLKKQKNQELVIMMFFIFILFLVGIYIMIERNIVDIIYFGIIIYYFRRFFVIKRNGV